MKMRFLAGVALGLFAFLAHSEDSPKTARYAEGEAKFEVGTILYDWHDAKRDRNVPVKIYYPKSGKGPFPVIIFSHGLGGSREGYEYLGQAWAKHGYVSVHLQHLGSDAAVWRDAGLFDKMDAMRRSAFDPANAINRPRDVNFAIDELEKLNKGDPALARRLDLDHIGVGGHSFGAYTALAIAGETFLPRAGKESSLADSRVKAVIAMSAPVNANRPRMDAAFAKIRIPCYHMTGTKDTSPIGDTSPEERRLPFDHTNGSDQYLLTLEGGDHMVFSGRGKMLTSKKDEGFQKLISASSTAFWDAYLKNDAKAKGWLTNDFKKVLGKDGTFEIKLKK
jgi:predicted dienelactone hydrolase